MKRFCLLLTLLTLFTNSYSQLLNDSANNQQNYKYYIHKEKSQGVIAKVLVGSGTAFYLSSILFGFAPTGKSTPQYNYIYWTGVGGVLLASIPFIILSNKNGKKARQYKTSLELQSNSYQLHQLYYTAISLRVQL